MSFSARTSNSNKNFKQMELRILWIPKFSKQIMIRHEVDFAHPQPIADGVPQVVGARPIDGRGVLSIFWQFFVF